MTPYLDASAILRVVLGQQNALPDWPGTRRGVTSALAQVECMRTLDRLRLRGRLGDEAIAVRREAVFRIFDSLERVEVTGDVLARAAQSYTTVLGTLDAIHLATAILWRERTGADLVMATHDVALANAARATGLSVVGV